MLTYGDDPPKQLPARIEQNDLAANGMNASAATK